MTEGVGLKEMNFRGGIYFIFTVVGVQFGLSRSSFCVHKFICQV